MRSEVGQLLGVHKATVAGWDGDLLHPVVVDGFHRYHPAEVGGLKARRDKKRRDKGDPPLTPSKGEVEAAAFRMFDERASRRDVVVALHITHDEAQAYWEAYHEDFETAIVRKRRRDEEARIAKVEAEEREAREKRRLERAEKIKALMAVGGEKG